MVNHAFFYIIMVNHAFSYMTVVNHPIDHGHNCQPWLTMVNIAEMIDNGLTMVFQAFDHGQNS